MDGAGPGLRLLRRFVTTSSLFHRRSVFLACGVQESYLLPRPVTFSSAERSPPTVISLVGSKTAGRSLESQLGRSIHRPTPQPHQPSILLSHPRSEKLDSSDTPPPLQHSPPVSDAGRASTRESTPVRTPVAFACSSRRSEKERDLLLPWQRKSANICFPQSDLFLDSALLEPDFEDSCFPLFPQSLAGDPSYAMTGPASPLDIATPTRHTSASPSAPNKPSNLTSAIHEARADQFLDHHGMDVDGTTYDPLDNGSGARRQSSFSAGNQGSVSQWGSGAKPILVQNPNRERPRRESMAGSMVGGMSWGGISVGSWIRDDLIMAGSSPFNPNPSSSQHSSSYLPKMEASFMRDFSCCGLKISDFHNLVQHYEEEHAEHAPPTMRGYTQSGQMGRLSSTPNSRAAIATNAAAAIQQRSQNPHDQPQRPPPGGSDGASFGAPRPTEENQAMRQQNLSQAGNFRKSPLPTVQDIDGAEDMDMDDVTMTGNDEVAPPALLASHKFQSQNTPQSHIGPRNERSPSPGVPSLNLVTANIHNQYHQGLRTSQPTTPASASHYGNAFQNNPTVSSVNTPTLSTNNLQQQQQRHQYGFSNASSPETPHEEDPDVFSNVPLDVPKQINGQYFLGNENFQMDYGSGNSMLDLCIDEPAKRLFSPNGMFSNPGQYGQLQAGGEQYNHDRDLVQRFRDQQLNAGVSGNSTGIVPGEEIKPFRCPVLGCEKAYKNQNGLKYHKGHGHQNQKLHENADGTFSIVNPETHIPYPGTLGMEKEKPYRCETCGKRYKNLNGLKYHRAHSAPCNPDLKMPGGGPMNTAAGVGGLGGMPMMGMNTPGTSIPPGTNEGMVQ
ncbi:MAG: Transcriptional regulator of ribosomal biogenesis proteins [Sclerophora amabilis]|nr:MAG: Transcriptional regulator of ribosomal biogenesis proteins [Sclerophora amabilis]